MNTWCYCTDTLFRQNLPKSLPYYGGRLENNNNDNNDMTCERCVLDTILSSMGRISLLLVQLHTWLHLNEERGDSFCCCYWCQSLFSVMLHPSSTHTNILANVWILGITTIKRQREHFLTETLIPSGLYDFSSWVSWRWHWVTPTTWSRKWLTLYIAAAGRVPVSAAAISCCSKHSSLLGRSWYNCPKEHV